MISEDSLPPSEASSRSSQQSLPIKRNVTFLSAQGPNLESIPSAIEQREPKKRKNSLMMPDAAPVYESDPGTHTSTDSENSESRKNRAKRERKREKMLLMFQQKKGINLRPEEVQYGIEQKVPIYIAILLALQVGGESKCNVCCCILNSFSVSVIFSRI